jgi:hypothetical protein
MKHFSPSEFVDFAEGTLAPARAAHADSCDDCRAQGALVRDAMRATAAPEIPEPSPLFWEHFSARVREGVAAEASHTAWSWLGGRESMRLAAGIAIVVALVSTAWIVRDAQGPRTPVPPAQEQAAATPLTGQNGDVDAGLDAGNAEVWAVLTAAASDMAIEEARAAGMKPHPAAVDRAVQHMTTAELTELGRLLQSELKRSSN